MDEADRAQKREEEQRQRALDAVLISVAMERRPTGAKDCEDCGDPIPKERLAILPGATRCTDCQHLHELSMRGRP